MALGNQAKPETGINDMYQFELFGGCDEYQDYELRETGRNAACRSIVLTIHNGKPSYAVVRRSQTNESEFGDKAEFTLGHKAFAALAKAFTESESA